MQLRESFCSRFLYTCIASTCFDGEVTLRQLNGAWTQEMLELYHDGFQAGNNTVFKSKHVSMFFMKAIVYIQNMFKLLQHVATMIDP